MDSCPRDNQNNIILSMKLEDPVGGVGIDNGTASVLDGVVYSSVKRNHYLIEAYRWLVSQVFNKYGAEESAERLSGVIGTQVFAMDAAGTSVNRDILYPFRVVVGTTPIFFRDKKSNLDTDVVRYANRAFAMEAEKIYVYLRIAGVMTKQVSGSATLYYLKSPRIDSTSGTEVPTNSLPDITLENWANDACVYYAAGIALLDSASSIVDPDEGMIKIGNRFIAMALQKLP